jgi:hypothetical protein
MTLVMGREHFQKPLQTEGPGKELPPKSYRGHVPLRMRNQTSRAIVNFEMSSESPGNKRHDPNSENTSAADACLPILEENILYIQEDYCGEEESEVDNVFRQEGRMTRRLLADKKVECEKTCKNIWSRKRWSLGRQGTD